MLSLPGIDLLSLQASLKYQRDTPSITRIFDPIRRKYFIATPEEVVRQLWIIYLTEIRQINPKLIAVERAFNINGLDKRFDLVVFTKSTHPSLLAEFKSPGSTISQMTFDQIAQYNMKLQVPYALVSNGRQHYCFRIDDEEKKFVWLHEIPV